ncbi:hypothetical protein MCUN1_003784 [Malassezia cuniculi]|uniref:Major allergen Mal f 1 n=1 Tax=Malassezia cuniculi TaxID=948313 RepID=A0AAF0F289_9BASI|nr:hypothetical protein MCUN1_003784 [Malassezia cuniculi]
MRAFTVAGLTALCASAIAASLPDTITVKGTNIYPEDTVWDSTRDLFYQSNLWRGKVSVWDNKKKEQFDVNIPGVTSDGTGDQQAAGVSLSSTSNAKHFFVVAKNSAAFRFDSSQKNDGACSYHAFSLPLTRDSKPKWSVYFDDVQKEFQQRQGTRPFGPVAAAQDNDGNSYVVFALGIPAVAKITRGGKNVIPWGYENSNGSQRPGYTGVAFDPQSNKLLAFGGPRPLTAYDVTSDWGYPTAVKINGNFGTLSGTEKLTLVPVNNRSVLVGARSPYAIAFHSDDGWKTATIKKTKDDRLANVGFTVVTYYTKGNQIGIYGGGAYFSDGANGGRTDFPLYKLDSSILDN